MEQQMFLRKCAKESDLKSNFILFESSKTTLSKTPVEKMQYDFNYTLDEDQSNTVPTAPRTDRKSFFRDLGIPTMCVILPLTLLSTALLALVIHGQKSINRSSVFQPDVSFVAETSGYILVNISNTWLLALSSIASTVASLLAPVIMTIQMYLNAQAMQTNSNAAQYTLGVTNKLPTPYQLSLTLGLASGNPQRLWRFEKYSRATSNRIPPMMQRTARMLKLSLLLSTLVFAADQVIHYTTSTVLISQATKVDEVSNFGRGLTETCLTMSREENYFEPCSDDFSLSLNQTQAEQNSLLLLQHGTSTVSSVDLVLADDNQYNTIALLTAKGVDANIDYRASSIGVSTQCWPITSGCAMTPAGDFTNFSCSDNFWGVLDMAPAETSNASTIDPNMPPLAFKWSRNLQLAFFEDSALSIPYNSIGLNPSTGEPDADLPGIPDAKLINPVYFAIAGDFGLSSELGGVNLSADPGFYTGIDYLAVVLNCSYQTLDVMYTSQNGVFGDFAITPTTNGTVAEIYHGHLQSFSLGGADAQLQDILATAALQPNGIAFADTWATLYSKQVLSVIGAVTSPRSNLEEQIRKQILVTKLLIPALVVSLALNLAYLPLGLYLFHVAYQQASHIDLGDLFARLSIPGVVTSLFGAPEISSSQGISDHGFDEKKIVREAAHVEAVLEAGNQYRLQPTWHGV